MTRKPTRRNVLAATSAAAIGSAVPRSSRAQAAGKETDFVYCLNTSTISGQKLKLPQQINVTAKAGYTAIEPWIRDIEAHIKEGGTLSDIRKQLADLGLSVEDTIGFAPWIVDDDAARKKGLEQAKRDMDLSAQIGAKRIAAPAAGAQQVEGMDLQKIAERYRVLCDIGDQIGIVPMVEVWGFSKTLGKLSEAVFVATESGHPKACVLADVYHLYKGGSDLSMLKLLSRQCIQMIHFNDYPAQPNRAEIKDEHRVFPGEGIGPVTQVLKDLRAMGPPPCVLSLELFNRQYWKLDALVCAKTGLEKAQQAVRKSIG
jgi:sugar phosphate isomerase/epimerase